MNYDIFIKSVRAHLTAYKSHVLGVKECGKYRNMEYGHIFFEIKYTEREFGSATSKSADYTEIKRRFHGGAEISYADYLKSYQLVRNVCLSPKGGANHTVFLVPKENRSINHHYDNGLSSIANIERFNVQRLFWEDLLEKIPDGSVFEKYFNYNQG